jgi:hypothetical protein
VARLEDQNLVLDDARYLVVPSEKVHDSLEDEQGAHRALRRGQRSASGTVRLAVDPHVCRRFT